MVLVTLQSLVTGLHKYGRVTKIRAPTVSGFLLQPPPQLDNHFLDAMVCIIEKVNPIMARDKKLTSESFTKIKSNICLDSFILKKYFLIRKINNFRVDLSNISV